MSANIDLPQVVDYHDAPWQLKTQGVWIKESSVSKAMSLDRGRLTLRYPFHRFKTTTIGLSVTNGSCQIDFGADAVIELRVGQHIIIPPLTPFAILPRAQGNGNMRFVEMDIISTPAWNADDMEFLE